MIFIDNKIELDEYAKAYASKTPANSLKNLAFQNLPALFAKYKTNNIALDFGCGAGYSTGFLKSLGFNTIGVDINPKMVELAKSTDINGQYSTVIDSQIPYEDKRFDLALAAFVLLEISSLQEIKNTLVEISRVLKPGAHFAAIVGNENTYKYNWSSLNTNFPQNKNFKSGDKVKIEFVDQGFSIEDYYWSQEDYLSAMYNANFELLEIYNPIADPKDGVDWRDETRISPNSIYFMQKTYM